MAALPDALDETTKKSVAALKAQHEKEIEQLHAQIGRLTMKLVWLEKKKRKYGVALDQSEFDRMG